MSRWLEEKVCLLVGAGSGIGRAVVDAYLEQGARLIVVERSPEKCRDLAGLDGVVALEGDATDVEDMRGAVGATIEAYGRLDVLATFVGVFDHYTPLLSISDDDFEAAFAEMMNVNIRSLMIAVRAGAEALRSSRGSIVITASSSSFYAGRGGALYVTSKFGVRGLVVQLARELAPDVRVNGVAPGGTIGTDLRGLGALRLDADRLDDRPGRAAGIEQRTPLHIAMRGEDHAGLYVLLASDRSRSMTGEILRSDGGMGVA